MIEATLAPFISSFAAALSEKFGVGDKVVLQSNTGTLMAAKDGGPHLDGAEFVLIASSQVSGWETWIIKRGHDWENPDR